MAAVVALALSLASAASATNYTWSGGGGSANSWSNGANWVGGMAPSENAAIGSLTFPELSERAIASNDLSGLSINELRIDDTNGYALGDQGFSLGSGGLSVTESGHGGYLEMYNPITLAGSQTWTIAGSAKVGQTTEESGWQAVEMTGVLSGEAANLTVELLNPNTWFVLGDQDVHPATDDEIGNITITGTGASNLDQVFLDGDLNASDGKTVTVEGASLFTEHATGPLVGIDASLSPEEHATIPSLTSRGSQLRLPPRLALPQASFDSGSTVQVGLLGSGAEAGSDYSQLTSTGTLDLGGATLELNAFGALLQSGACPQPPPGQVDTLISTTGSLSSTFGNAPEGSTVVARECYNLGPHGEVVSEGHPAFRINYHTSGEPQTVTATALGNVPALAAPPTIAGTPTEGQTITEGHGTWTNEPTSYTYQWQRCDSAGNNCLPIAGATGQSYSLTASDVGSTIRVQEIASNSEGSSEPASSAATGVITAASTGGSGGGSSPGGSTGGSGGAGSSGSSSGGSPSSTGSSTGSPGGIPAVVTISSGAIRTWLGNLLKPAGTVLSSRSLLRHGGLSLSIKALEAGTLSVQWSYVPQGPKTAQARSVVVASGKVSFAAAGTGKLVLRLTAAGRRLLRAHHGVKLVARATFVAVKAMAVVASRGVVVPG